ncbi:MAG: hypothetical protein LBG06_06255 [Deltaproteobacteria bacterium]|jgi:zinc transporter ZupT|nr:hypothetical protein [Deltaproteobacteria bacterium]
MARNLIPAMLAFVLGLLLVEAGALSVCVSFAYSEVDGSAVPLLAGGLLILAGAAFVVLATRLLRRKDARRRSFFEG